MRLTGRPPRYKPWWLVVGAVASILLLCSLSHAVPVDITELNEDHGASSSAHAGPTTEFGSFNEANRASNPAHGGSIPESARFDSEHGSFHSASDGSATAVHAYAQQKVQAARQKLQAARSRLGQLGAPSMQAIRSRLAQAPASLHKSFQNMLYGPRRGEIEVRPIFAKSPYELGNIERSQGESADYTQEEVKARNPHLTPEQWEQYAANRAGYSMSPEEAKALAADKAAATSPENLRKLGLDWAIPGNAATQHAESSGHAVLTDKEDGQSVHSDLSDSDRHSGQYSELYDPNAPLSEWLYEPAWDRWKRKMSNGLKRLKFWDPKARKSLRPEPGWRDSDPVTDLDEHYRTGPAKDSYHAAHPEEHVEESLHDSPSDRHAGQASNVIDAEAPPSPLPQELAVIDQRKRKDLHVRFDSSQDIVIPDEAEIAGHAAQAGQTIPTRLKDMYLGGKKANMLEVGPRWVYRQVPEAVKIDRYFRVAGNRYYLPSGDAAMSDMSGQAVASRVSAVYSHGLGSDVEHGGPAVQAESSSRAAQIEEHEESYPPDDLNGKRPDQVSENIEHEGPPDLSHKPTDIEQFNKQSHVGPFDDTKTIHDTSEAAQASTSRAPSAGPLSWASWRRKLKNGLARLKFWKSRGRGGNDAESNAAAQSDLGRASSVRPSGLDSDGEHGDPAGRAESSDHVAWMKQPGGQAVQEGLSDRRFGKSPDIIQQEGSRFVVAGVPGKEASSIVPVPGRKSLAPSWSNVESRVVALTQAERPPLAGRLTWDSMADFVRPSSQAGISDHVIPRQGRASQLSAQPGLGKVKSIVRKLESQDYAPASAPLRPSSPSLVATEIPVQRALPPNPQLQRQSSSASVDEGIRQMRQKLAQGADAVVEAVEHGPSSLHLRKRGLLSRKKVKEMQLIGDPHQYPGQFYRVTLPSTEPVFYFFNPVAQHLRDAPVNQYDRLLPSHQKRIRNTFPNSEKARKNNWAEAGKYLNPVDDYRVWGSDHYVPGRGPGQLVYGNNDGQYRFTFVPKETPPRSFLDKLLNRNNGIYHMVKQEKLPKHVRDWVDLFRGQFIPTLADIRARPRKRSLSTDLGRSSSLAGNSDKGTMDISLGSSDQAQPSLHSGLESEPGSEAQSSKKRHLDHGGVEDRLDDEEWTGQKRPRYDAGPLEHGNDDKEYKYPVYEYPQPRADESPNLYPNYRTTLRYPGRDLYVYPHLKGVEVDFVDPFSSRNNDLKFPKYADLDHWKQKEVRKLIPGIDKVANGQIKPHDLRLDWKYHKTFPGRGPEFIRVWRIRDDRSWRTRPRPYVLLFSRITPMGRTIDYREFSTLPRHLKKWVKQMHPDIYNQAAAESGPRWFQKIGDWRFPGNWHFPGSWRFHLKKRSLASAEPAAVDGTSQEGRSSQDSVARRLSPKVDQKRGYTGDASSASPLPKVIEYPGEEVIIYPHHPGVLVRWEPRHHDGDSSDKLFGLQSERRQELLKQMFPGIDRVALGELTAEGAGLSPEQTDHSTRVYRDGRRPFRMDDAFGRHIDLAGDFESISHHPVHHRSGTIRRPLPGRASETILVLRESHSESDISGSHPAIYFQRDDGTYQFEHLPDHIRSWIAEARPDLAAEAAPGWLEKSGIRQFHLRKRTQGSEGFFQRLLKRPLGAPNTERVHEFQYPGENILVFRPHENIYWFHVPSRHPERTEVTSRSYEKLEPEYQLTVDQSIPEMKPFLHKETEQLHPSLEFKPHGAYHNLPTLQRLDVNMPPETIHMERKYVRGQKEPLIVFKRWSPTSFLGEYTWSELPIHIQKLIKERHYGAWAEATKTAVRLLPRDAPSSPGEIDHQGERLEKRMDASKPSSSGEEVLRFDYPGKDIIVTRGRRGYSFQVPDHNRPKEFRSGSLQHLTEEERNIVLESIPKIQDVLDGKIKPHKAGLNFPRGRKAPFVVCVPSSNYPKETLPLTRRKGVDWLLSKATLKSPFVFIPIQNPSSEPTFSTYKKLPDYLKDWLQENHAEELSQAVQKGLKLRKRDVLPAAVASNDHRSKSDGLGARTKGSDEAAPRQLKHIARTLKVRSSDSDIRYQRLLNEPSSSGGGSSTKGPWYFEFPGDDIIFSKADRGGYMFHYPNGYKPFQLLEDEVKAAVRETYPNFEAVINGEKTEQDAGIIFSQDHKFNQKIIRIKHPNRPRETIKMVRQKSLFDTVLQRKPKDTWRFTRISSTGAESLPSKFTELPDYIRNWLQAEHNQVIEMAAKKGLKRLKRDLLSAAVDTDDHGSDSHDPAVHLKAQANEPNSRYEKLLDYSSSSVKGSSTKDSFKLDYPGENIAFWRADDGEFVFIEPDGGSKVGVKLFDGLSDKAKDAVREKFLAIEAIVRGIVPETKLGVEPEKGDDTGGRPTYRVRHPHFPPEGLLFVRQKPNMFRNPWANEDPWRVIRIGPKASESSESRFEELPQYLRTWLLKTNKSVPQEAAKKGLKLRKRNIQSNGVRVDRSRGIVLEYPGAELVVQRFGPGDYLFGLPLPGDPSRMMKFAKYHHLDPKYRALVKETIPNIYGVIQNPSTEKDLKLVFEKHGKDDEYPGMEIIVQRSQSRKPRGS